MHSLSWDTRTLMQEPSDILQTRYGFEKMKGNNINVYLLPFYEEDAGVHWLNIEILEFKLKNPMLYTLSLQVVSEEEEEDIAYVSVLPWKACKYMIEKLLDYIPLQKSWWVTYVDQSPRPVVAARKVFRQSDLDAMAKEGEA